MSLIERFQSYAQKYLIGNPTRRSDRLLGALRAVGSFFDRIREPLSKRIHTHAETDTPSAKIYNRDLRNLGEDIESIRDHQKSMLNGLLISWNQTEEIVEKTTSEVKSQQELIDTSVPPIALSPAQSQGVTTLGVTSFQSANTNIKSMTMTATATKDVPVTYGKAYGLYIPGAESSEDGIRPNNNDPHLIIDKKDSFWEVEAVTLQKPFVDSYTTQTLEEDELNLSVNITIAFNSTTVINTLYLTPHNFAKSVYYDITSIDVIQGHTTIPVDIPVSSVKSATTRVSFNAIAADGVQITLTQNKGYYIKYSLARYMLSNNATWVDLTGQPLMERLSAIPEATNPATMNQIIANQIQYAGGWILSAWAPDAPDATSAILDTSAGNSGYKNVESYESSRKRWAIGIQELDIGLEVYEGSSEASSMVYTLPEDAVSVILNTEDIVPTGTSLSYEVTFGDKRYSLRPINWPPKLTEEYYMEPQRLYINSDLSRTRQENSIYGPSAYVDASTDQMRIRIIMEKTSGNLSPQVRSFTPTFERRS